MDGKYDVHRLIPVCRSCVEDDVMMRLSVCMHMYIREQ